MASNKIFSLSDETWSADSADKRSVETPGWPHCPKHSASVSYDKKSV